MILVFEYKKYKYCCLFVVSFFVLPLHPFLFSFPVSLNLFIGEVNLFILAVLTVFAVFVFSYAIATDDVSVVVVTAVIASVLVVPDVGYHKNLP